MGTPKKPGGLGRVSLILWGLALVLTAGACSGELASPAPSPPPTATSPNALLPPPNEKEEQCDVQEMSLWSDEKWHDMGAAYIAATILVGIAGTDYSQSPGDLERYRDFLKGPQGIVENQWNVLFDTHAHVKQVVITAQDASPIKTATTTVFLPRFPREWTTRYDGVVSLGGASDGTIRFNENVIALPPAQVRDMLDVLDNQFHCRIAEARRLSE